MGLRHMEQTKAGVVVISQTIYHVSEGADYHLMTAACRPGEPRAPEADPAGWTSTRDRPNRGACG